MTEPYQLPPEVIAQARALGRRLAETCPPTSDELRLIDHHIGDGLRARVAARAKAARKPAA